MRSGRHPVTCSHSNTSRKPGVLLSAAIFVLIAASSPRAAEPSNAPPASSRYFLPDKAASHVVSVSASGAASRSIVVLTEAVAVKETGPKSVIERFGEVYAFSPAFIAVHRDEPTRITLWNLQPDDEHDFMLEDRPGHALMHLRLAPLSKTSYVYRFHREGLFDFRCAVHQPEMNGQIMVLPPRLK
jgi:plastocyanin